MIFAIVACLAIEPLRLESEWTAPGQLPFSRVHAIVKTPSDYYIGGLRGLARGKPGKWNVIDERPVKQMLHDGESVWVLFGDGSVDKIEYKRDRLIFDILNGVAKRPWVACLGMDGKTVLMGGQGGWFGRGMDPIEIYRKELDGQVITTVGRYDGTLWLGTQRKGLFSYRNGSLTRYGFAAGIPDSWITATVQADRGLVVGVADGGLCKFLRSKFVPQASPCIKVRHLSVLSGQLVVGDMAGCWFQGTKAWQQLSEGETTCLAVIEDRVFVGTPVGLRIWRKP